MALIAALPFNQKQKNFFKNGNLAGIQPGYRQKLRLQLIALDMATCVEDMNTPGWRFHGLKGDHQGLWTIDVNRNRRIVFEFKQIIEPRLFLQTRYLRLPNKFVLTLACMRYF